MIYLILFMLLAFQTEVPAEPAQGPIIDRIIKRIDTPKPDRPKIIERPIIPPRKDWQVTKFMWAAFALVIAIIVLVIILWIKRAVE